MRYPHQIISILFLLLSGLAIDGFGQGRKCGTVARWEAYYRQHPEISSSHQSLEQRLSRIASQHHQKRTVLTIPVVVHVVYRNASQNISDAQIISQIEALNADFRKLNADTALIPSIFKPLAGDAAIEFCLATRDPQGNPTDGITRTPTTRNYFEPDDAVKFSSMGGKDAWNTEQYLNIWVCRMGGQDPVLGYAQFPWMGSSATDGVVIDYQHFGTIGTAVLPARGRTATHEVGHWLGLWHIWGDDNGDCTGTDYVDDTPNQGDNYWGCPAWPQSSCGSEDMYMNYMDYTDGDCQNMFTLGQVARMHAIIDSLRPGLKNSVGCIPLNIPVLDVAVSRLVFPVNTVCAEWLTPFVEIRNLRAITLTEATFAIQIDQDTIIYQNWTGSVDSGEATIVKLEPVRMPGGQHDLLIEIQNPNNTFDADLNNNFIQATVNVDLSSSSNPVSSAYQGFEDQGFPPAGWSVENPDGDRTWLRTLATGGYGSSQACAYFNNYNGNPDPSGKRDALISPVFDFSDQTLFYHLTIDYAYAQYSPSRFDSLNIYYSLDCGSSWHKLWGDGGVFLATAPSINVTTPFTPANNEWRTLDLDVTFLNGNGAVQFKFENLSGNGNNLYLDNFNITTEPTGINPVSQGQPSIQVFPNPAAHELYVTLNASLKTGFDWEIIDLQGRHVLNGKGSSQKRISISVKDLLPGIYYLRITDAKAIFTTRFVKSP